MTRRRIAIIGAGLGGLSAAARLACDGHDVDVFDSQTFPGGKAGSERIGAFRFDTGPSLVTMPDVFDQLFAETGETRDAYISLEPLDEICRYHFADGSKLTSYADTAKFAAEVEAKTDDTGADLLRFLDYSGRIHEITSDLFLRKSLHEISTYTNFAALRSILLLPRIDALRSMNRAVRSFFKDPRMVQFFDRYATYNGSNPYRTPGTLNIIPHVEYGYSLEPGMTRAAACSGGITAIPRGIAQLARDKGARIHLSTRVNSIRYDKKSRRIQGLTVSSADGSSGDEELDFDVVVSNADVNHTYRELLDDTEAKLYKRYEKLEPSSSGLVFFWGMNDSFDDLGLHNIFFSSDYHQEFADIFERGRCPTDPTVYINITSKITADDAPDGGENWFILINAPYNSSQNWEVESARVKSVVLSKISKALGRDVEQAIAVESILHPEEIEKRTGSRFGSLYGISSNSRTAAFMRHPNRCRRYPGLFFCGGSAHPGGGMPLVVLSGKITADLVRREIRRGRL